MLPVQERSLSTSTWYPVMSTHTSPGYNLKKLLEQTVATPSDLFQVKKKMRTCLKELGFIKKGFLLQVSDPSYKIRYLYALNFWSKETENSVIGKKDADELIDNLKEEINCKECVYSENVKSNKIADDFFFKIDKKVKEKSSADQSNKKSVWYVTSKCDNAFYVKSSNKDEAEVRINIEEIRCDYKLICPGDEVQIMKDNLMIQSVHITK